MRVRALMPAVLALALGPGGPAWGADQPASAVPAPVVPAVSPGATPDAAAPAPVRIGILTDETGAYAETGGMGNVIAARLAIADYGGRVLGRPIALVDADHGNDPAVGGRILTDWFDTGGIDAVAGLSTSSVALAAQEIARTRTKTLLIAGAPDSDLTGMACSATSSHWAEDTYALARSTAEAVVPSGGDSWFFVTVDQAFGQAMERDATAAVRSQGASVLGRFGFPLGTADFSAALDAARTSGARIVALADTGADLVNFFKQADAAKIRTSNQALASLQAYITDIDAIGLDAAQRLYVTEGFYWDQNDAARAFARRFNAEAHHMPTKQQAATYASVAHYLKAADAAGTLDAPAVNVRMRDMPVDFFGRAGKIRADGQVVYDLTLYQVKSPAESQYPWDYLKKVRDIPAERAFRPADANGCPLAK